MRRYNFVALVLIDLVMLLLIFFGSQKAKKGNFHSAIEEMQTLTQIFKLSDVCLSTEAKYLRHLSAAEYFAAFQDHPLALEHFPGGSIIPPPRLTLTKDKGR